MSRVICPTDTAVKTSSTVPPSDHRTHLLFNSRRPFAGRSVLVVRGAAELRHVRNERVLLRVRDGWMDTVRTATLCGCRSHRRREGGREQGARSSRFFLLLLLLLRPAYFVFPCHLDTCFTWATMITLVDHVRVQSLAFGSNRVAY